MRKNRKKATVANQEIYHTKVEFHAPRVLLYCKILYFMSSWTKWEQFVTFPWQENILASMVLIALLQRPRLWNCYFFLFDTTIAKSLIWSHLDIIRSVIYERIFIYRHVSDPVMYLDLKMKMHLIEESREHAAPSSAVSSGWWCDYPEFSWPFKKRNIVPFAKRCRPISYIEFFLPKDNAWMERSENSTLLTYFYQPCSG